jgi:hypothetical protein
MSDVLGRDVGPELVDYLYRMLQVDEEWGVRDARGFAWWGHSVAQRITAAPARDLDGLLVTRVAIEADVLRDVPDTPHTADVVSLLNMHASLSAYVWEPAAGRVRLSCTAYAHEGNIVWLRRLLAGVAAIQAADAYLKSLVLPEIVGAMPDTSAHPEHGARPLPDDMLNVLDRVFVPAGEEPSRWTSTDFEGALTAEETPWLLATGGDDEAGLTAEFAFEDEAPALVGGAAALFQATAGERNPQLGNGLLVRLALPLVGIEDQAVRLANDLNLAEAREWTGVHLLGAWCRDPGGGLSHVSFVPNALHMAGLIDALAWNAALRTEWSRAALDRLAP